MPFPGTLPVPPQVQPGPRVLKVLAGEALDLNCVAEGNPQPQLKWFKDGMALTGEGPQGSVHFAAVKTSDAGLYRCEASSSAGTDTWKLELLVLGESQSLSPSAMTYTSLSSACWVWRSKSSEPTCRLHDLRFVQMVCGL